MADEEMTNEPEEKAKETSRPTSAAKAKVKEATCSRCGAALEVPAGVEGQMTCPTCGMQTSL